MAKGCKMKLGLCLSLAPICRLFTYLLKEAISRDLTVISDLTELNESRLVIKDSPWLQKLDLKFDILMFLSHRDILWKTMYYLNPPIIISLSIAGFGPIHRH
jgi:hypothetical protein